MSDRCLTCGGTGAVINDESYDGDFMVKTCPDCAEKFRIKRASMPEKALVWHKRGDRNRVALRK